MVRRVVVALISVIVVIAGVLTLAWAFQRQLIYLPSTDPAPSVTEIIGSGRDVRLRTSDGLVLGGWLVPPAGTDRGQVVLVANGNAGDRSGRAPLASALADRGFSVLLFDYRGYGGNPGSPSETGLRRDARAAYDLLVSEEGFDPGQLIYFGESLGAAVLTDLATSRPPAGLVLRSPFVDLAAAGSVHYPFLPVRWLLKDRFPVAEQIATVTAPTTVVLGTADRIIPPEQSVAVAAAAGGPSRVVEVAGADHNDAELGHGPEVIDAVVALADSVR